MNSNEERGHVGHDRLTGWIWIQPTIADKWGAESRPAGRLFRSVNWRVEIRTVSKEIGKMANRVLCRGNNKMADCALYGGNQGGASSVNKQRGGIDGGGP